MTLIRKTIDLDGIHVDQHRLPHFAFVDADNMQKSFRKKLEEFGATDDQISQFSFVKLFQLLSHDRVYFYSATEDPECLPVWLEDIRAQQGFVLKLGVLTQKGKSKKQEGVDVKLAIDATRLAFASIMKTCTLYGADGDFIPLVEALSDAGCIVNVVSFNDPSQGRVAPRLQAEADSYRRIEGPWLFSTNNFRPVVSQTGSMIHEQVRGETVEIHGEPVTIHQRGDRYLAILNQNKNPTTHSCSDREQLILWLKMHSEKLE